MNTSIRMKQRKRDKNSIKLFCNLDDGKITHSLIWKLLLPCLSVNKSFDLVFFCDKPSSEGPGIKCWIRVPNFLAVFAVEYTTAMRNYQLCFAYIRFALIIGTCHNVVALSARTVTTSHIARLMMQNVRRMQCTTKWHADVDLLRLTT